MSGRTRDGLPEEGTVPNSRSGPKEPQVVSGPHNDSDEDEDGDNTASETGDQPDLRTAWECSLGIGKSTRQDTVEWILEVTELLLLIRVLC